MNILVTGKNGQLGSEFQDLSASSQHNFVFADSNECDIHDIKSIESIVISNNINAIINCAAYTAVDNAEDNEMDALQTNLFGVNNINQVAESHDLSYIHISTDYVFDGTKKSPYEPTDPTSPIGIYGTSKYLGEQVIVNSKAQAIIIRTSWLYSSYGNNFVKTMLRLGNENKSLNVVSDQIGSPTYARDLAEACIKIIDTGEFGATQRVYHYANSGSISWFDFALKIMTEGDLDCKVESISTSEYPTKAKRPAYSVLSTVDIERDFEVTVPTWEQS
ncbi:MAG: dTDP-4-dehydrorhamnose reductase, partial [Crocinitomicaceae bacterium]|nr:dTDP-4-dehydrorhamnose reductase [Crocinitomicaceae bacterium]